MIYVNVNESVSSMQ